MKKIVKRELRKPSESTRQDIDTENLRDDMHIPEPLTKKQIKKIEDFRYELLEMMGMAYNTQDDEYEVLDLNVSQNLFYTLFRMIFRNHLPDHKEIPTMMSLKIDREIMMELLELIKWELSQVKWSKEAYGRKDFLEETEKKKS